MSQSNQTAASGVCDAQRAPTRAWRSPQLVRDLKTKRRGVPEHIRTVDREVAIPLFLGKLHGELYEIEDAPRDAEEYGDFVTALSDLCVIVSPSWSKASLDDVKRTCGYSRSTNISVFPMLVACWRDAPAKGALSLKPFGSPPETGGDTHRALAFGRLHRLIEHCGRDLTDATSFLAVVEAFAECCSVNRVDPTQVLDCWRAKRDRYGTFEGRVLWHDTEY
jgi:hypothetical protein